MSQPLGDRARAWHLVGNDDLALNRPDDAVNAFTEAINLDPRNAAIDYASRAIAALRRNDRAAAVSDYRRAVELDATKIESMLSASAELNEIASQARDSVSISQPATPGASADDPAEACTQWVHSYQPNNHATTEQIEQWRRTCEQRASGLDCTWARDMIHRGWPKTRPLACVHTD